jgi:hypothetical protein
MNTSLMNAKMEQEATVAVSVLPHVQEVLRTAHEELSGLLRQRDDIMKRIGKIKQMLSGMANLFGESVLYEELRVALEGRPSDRRKGFTRACRQILMQSRSPLPLRYFLGELRRKFPEVADRHKDLSASVTTVFHRLATYGEARWSEEKEGGRVWEWVAETRTSADERLLTGLEATGLEAADLGVAGLEVVQPQPPRIEAQK